MSVSGFHAHLKAVNAMSPLQFQKQLRLQEARRLMISQNFDAAEAGYRVGYNDASHFSREYKRHFGEPPIRDVEQLRDLVARRLSHSYEVSLKYAGSEGVHFCDLFTCDQETRVVCAAQ